MTPGAAVSGYYFSHPDSRYFGVADIGLDQDSDCRRRSRRLGANPQALRIRVAGPDTAGGLSLPEDLGYMTFLPVKLLQDRGQSKILLCPLSAA
jgi:hypothetical protein